MLSRTDLKLLEQKDQPVKATIIYIIYTLIKTSSFVLTSLLYIRNENLSPFQMLLMRSVFAWVFQIIWVNKDLKKACWDDINRGNVGPLATRVFQGSITNIVNYSVTKYISRTFIAVVNGMGPPLTVALCFLLLKERINCFETIMLGIIVVGTLIYSIAESGSDEDSDLAHAGKTMTIVMYVALFCNPVLSALGTISMRKMKKFHEAVVSFYLNLGIGITSLIVILIEQRGFKEITDFDWQSWMLCVAIGLTGVMSQTARFRALKLEKAVKLQKLAPLTTVWQVVFDLTIFGKSYNLLQWLGLSLLFMVYIFSGLKFLIWDLPKQKKRD